MLTGPAFATMLRAHGFAFATGVPCSLIEDLIRTLDQGTHLSYVPAVREDVAVGLAAGAWLAGQRPVVLMQNSGLGTSMNALASMSLVYGFPALLVVTWRGHEGKDAPEHILTGAITERHLALLGIPHRVLSAASAADDVAWAVAEMDARSQPVAILVPPGVFGGGHGAGCEVRGAAVSDLLSSSRGSFASSRLRMSAGHGGAPDLAAPCPRPMNSSHRRSRGLQRFVLPSSSSAASPSCTPTDTRRGNRMRSPIGHRIST